MTAEGWAAIGAVLTAQELQALGSLMARLARISDDELSNIDRAVISALTKLLDKPDGLPCCYIERARIVTLLNEQLLDEAPTNANPDPLAMARDAGYRAGHNDRARSLIRGLQS